ncbi:MAG: hypothetical protein CSA38_02380 [Flavobacteriales bacterium]|nr:MAG: hypothetical protein CSA38_02380 [Flavobacteriales bacterium]
MNYQRLVVRGISYSQSQSGAYALLLEHEESKMKLPIVIGDFEAQSISIVLEKVKSPRPLIQDLFTSFIDKSGYQLEFVVIHQMVEGVFFTNLHFSNLEGEEIVLDGRPSDAIAMALRFDAPIYTTKSILEEAGFLLDIDIQMDEEELEEEIQTFDDRIEEEDVAMTKMSNISIEKLNELLEQAVKDEDFDMALLLQEEIKKRENNN